MRHPLLTPRRALVATAVILLIVGFLPARWSRRVSNPPRQLVEHALAPFTDALNRYVARPLSARPDQAAGLPAEKQLERNYLALLSENTVLRTDLEQERRRVAELSRLRRQQTLEGLELLPARVTALKGDAANPMLTLNRGSRHGLRPGLVVVDAWSLHLVGRVVEVGPYYATVALITAPGTALPAAFVPTQTVPTMAPTETALTADRHGDFIAQVKVGANVDIGSLAQLAESRGSPWPAEARGFYIGKVVSMPPWPDNPQLYHKAVVRPLRPLIHLESVWVLSPVEVSTGTGGRNPR